MDDDDGVLLDLPSKWDCQPSDTRKRDETMNSPFHQSLLLLGARHSHLLEAHRIRRHIRHVDDDLGGYSADRGDAEVRDASADFPF